MSGTGASGEIRIVELADHPFFIATLFLPQTRSTAASPHPVIAGYAAAVSDVEAHRLGTPKSEAG